MYSGTTFTNISGAILGTHQKIDRVARRHLTMLMDNDESFPKIRKILHFEGNNGPDAIKRKSPAKDEPWHFYSPFDDDDNALVDIIVEHYQKLISELKNGNKERSAFEASWLAHAIVDGLTPAHHFPYEEKLVELRGGEGNETRDTLKGKWVLPGSTPVEKIKNNWKMWGPKGLFTTHGLFELGIATIIAPLSFSDAIPTTEHVRQTLDLGVAELFRRTAKEIAVKETYEQYYKTGWSAKLSLEIRQHLVPSIIQTVTLAWYCALVEAGLTKDIR